MQHAATMAVALLLLLSVLALIHALNWRLHREMHGPIGWLIGYVSRALGIVLLVLRGELPELISIVAGDTLLVAGYLISYNGLRLFAGLPIERRLTMFVLAPLLVGLVYFTFVEPSIAARWIVLAVCLTPTFFAILVSLYRIAARDGWLGTAALAIVNAAALACFATMALVGTPYEQEVARILTPEQILLAGFLVLLAVEVAQTYGYMLLTASRNSNELKRLALQDPLTRLPNRRALEIAFRQAGAAAARLDSGEIGLVLFDLDFFKRVNDEFGHQVGDAVLRHFAGIATAAIRPHDTLARIGGEEFALLVLNPGGNGAFEVADRIRTTLVATPFRLSGRELPITVSAGLTTVRSEDADFDAMYHTADEALYRAKDEGRNRVVVAQG